MVCQDASHLTTYCFVQVNDGLTVTASLESGLYSQLVKVFDQTVLSVNYHLEVDRVDGKSNDIE